MYLKRAADKGIGKAEYHLAYCCLAGEGTEKNPSLAVAYYQKALRHGYLHAAVELGVYYEMGVHVKQDRKRRASSTSGPQTGAMRRAGPIMRTACSPATW